MNFNFAKLLITIKLNREPSDPFALFNLRNGLKLAFKKEVGCDKKECICPRAFSCPFFLSFGQSLSSDPVAVKKYQKPPLPFMFDVPILHSKVSDAEIGFTLVGTALNYTDLYLSALKLLLREGILPGGLKADIWKVEAEGYSGERHHVAVTSEGKTSGLRLLSFDDLVKSSHPYDSTLPVTIVTPICIAQQGKMLRVLEPSLFVRAIMRRVSSLAYYYGQIELSANFTWLASRSKELAWEKAHFGWGQWNRDVSGITGSGILTNIGAEFYPFLKLGEFFHVGKGASDGFGQFRLGE